MKDSLRSHFFWKYANGKYSLFEKPVDTLYNEINVIIKFSYVFFLFLMFTQLSNKAYVLNETMIDPLWPVVMLKDISPVYIALVCQILLIIGFTLLTFLHHNRFLRIFVFVLFFLYLAFMNSFGKINHAFHLILMMLFCFMLIPGKQSDNYKEKTILMFAAAQFFVLLAYTLTGLWKLFWGVVEFFTQEVSLFSPLAFRNILVTQYQITNPTLLGSWFLEHYYMGYMFYVLVVLIEIFAVFAFFKSNLHKVWGILLMLMHLGIHYVLNVNMYPAIMVLGLLLILSPFQGRFNLRETIWSLPILAQIKKLRS